LPALSNEARLPSLAVAAVLMLLIALWGYRF
jgi:hypothetical protein